MVLAQLVLGVAMSVLAMSCSQQASDETAKRLDAFSDSSLLTPPSSASDAERYLQTACVDPDSPRAPVIGVRFRRPASLDANEVVERYGEVAVASGWILHSKATDAASDVNDATAVYRKDMDGWTAGFAVSASSNRETWLEVEQRRPANYCEYA